MEISPEFLKTAKRLKVVNGIVILDENSWSDLEWDLDGEIYDFMLDNRVDIKAYSIENNVTLKKALEALFLKSKS
ncbi:hypothetical protein D3C71_1213940 [compost metagenome]